MIKNIFIIIFISLYVFANNFKISDHISSFLIPDQFNKLHTIDENIQTIIVSFEKGTSTDINKFLKSKKDNFLEQHKSVFIANITDMPSILTKFFAIPKMKTYKHKILLINDENDHRFTKKDSKITIYKLKNGIIKNIFYISNIKELNKIFN